MTRKIQPPPLPDSPDLNRKEDICNKLIYIAIILAAAVNIPALIDHYNMPQKDDWRGLGVVLTDVLTSGDVFIVIPGYNKQPLDYYYKNSSHGILEYGANNMNDINIVIASNSEKRIWIITTGDIGDVDKDGKMIQWLETYTTLYWRDKYMGLGNIVLLRRL
jgi:hypothetical protein